MVNKREAIDSLHHSIASDYRDASGDGAHLKGPQVAHTFYTVVTTLGVGVIAITMIFVLVQNRTLSRDIKRNGIAIADYLDCIGHIQKPVAQRTQADYDKCLDNMRRTIKGGL